MIRESPPSPSLSKRGIPLEKGGQEGFSKIDANTVTRLFIRMEVVFNV
jgi:hypothetical protein